jgi:hypothetical protein
MKNLGNDIAVDQKRPERAAATSPRQRLGGENWEQISALQGQLKCKANAEPNLFELC